MREIQGTIHLVLALSQLVEVRNDQVKGSSNTIITYSVGVVKVVNNKFKKTYRIGTLP